jgi:hypothetical protein
MTCFCTWQIFFPIYKAKEIIIDIGFRPFDICYDNPLLWNYIKTTFIIFYMFSNFIFIYNIFSKFNLFIDYNSTENQSIEQNNTSLKLLIGKEVSSNKNIYVPESGLYQNFLITGTIGTGKTSSAMYPFTEQLLKYNSQNPTNKLGILILDVKGNYFKQVKQFATKYNLEKDILEISLKSNIKYNPLHKPCINPIILANRLKTILLLFSENNSESFWLDKAEQILAECIKLCRLYNNGYVTFVELHKLITEPDYYKSKIKILKKLFYESKFTNQQIYELNTALEFFEKEFNSLDSRTLSILKSEISRITNVFVSDYNVSKIFCPEKKELNFKGFSSMLRNGKIVILNMNIAEYKNLSKIIATYLKLDFQSEIMYNLSHSNVRPSAFICDEYAEYVTKTDAEFFSLSREAKCINIVSTQSYSSLKNTLKDESTVRVIIQNLINKIWFRTDDIFTIEEAQKQLGKEDKIHTSKSISESAKETRFNYITNSLNSQNSSITESLNTYTQKDFVYDTNFFTQELETFSSLAFLSDGTHILKPTKLKMFPFFKTQKG